jgi:pimeloyl-ACP methyl ester carboxylesterase
MDSSKIRCLRNLTVAVCLPLLFTMQGVAQAPGHWGPVSIGLEEIEYPHPVSWMEFSAQGKVVRMAYMDVPPSGSSNGQAVVLLHGLNFFGEYWAGTIDALTQEGFRVIVPDQIGFGRSSKPVIAYSFQKKAANTKKLLEMLEIEKAAIVGHSMGGMLAARFAFSYPETTSHLVLVNMIGKQDFRLTRPWSSTDEVYEAERNRSYEEIRRGQERYYVEWGEEYEKYIRIHYGWTLSPEFPRLAKVRALNRQMVYSQPVVYEFPHIESETLILSGREDGPDFAELAQMTAEAIPNSKLILLDNVGHNPHFEAPDRFHSELIHFLNSH